MSIYIKGMEMPREGELLCINIHPDGKVCINLDLSCTKVGTAVPVPPHGRVIDADAFTRTQGFHDFKYANGMVYVGVVEVVGLINAAPTIIPAEEERT